jgi:ABC-type uncharacterized transport system ATPase subunit
MFDDDNADKHITDAIERLCDKLRTMRIGTTEFDQTIEAIAKLRASINPTIIQQSK